jgi:Transposase, Mutator family
VSRRGGQLLTRARSASIDNGLPDLRLLPDAPVPDGRTVLTGPDASNVEVVRGHRRHLVPFIPVTNLLERSLGEVKRRTKVMGRFPGETSCLSLVWAVLDLFFTHASNGATFTEIDRQHLKRIKYQQADPDTIDEEMRAA